MKFLSLSLSLLFLLSSLVSAEERSDEDARLLKQAFRDMGRDNLHHLVDENEKSDKTIQERVKQALRKLQTGKTDGILNSSPGQKENLERAKERLLQLQQDGSGATHSRQELHKFLHQYANKKKQTSHDEL